MVDFNWYNNNSNNNKYDNSNNNNTDNDYVLSVDYAVLTLWDRNKMIGFKKNATCILLNENVCILIQVSLKYIPEGSIANTSFPDVAWVNGMVTYTWTNNDLVY